MPKLDPVILIVAALAVLVSLFVTINMAVRRFGELRRREQLDAAIPDDSMSGGFFISEVQVRGTLILSNIDAFDDRIFNEFPEHTEGR